MGGAGNAGDGYSRQTLLESRKEEHEVRIGTLYHFISLQMDRLKILK